MEEKNKERYEAPEIVVVELKVEGRVLMDSNADWDGFNDSYEL